MKYQRRADFWPGKIIQKGRNLRTLIRNTKSENKSDLLVFTRNGLTDALKPDYDLKCPQTVVKWAQKVLWQVKRAALDLEFVINAKDRKLPNTTSVFRHAGNLAEEIEKIIGKIELLTEEQE